DSLTEHGPAATRKFARAHGCRSRYPISASVPDSPPHWFSILGSPSLTFTFARSVGHASTRIFFAASSMPARTNTDSPVCESLAYFDACTRRSSLEARRRFKFPEATTLAGLHAAARQLVTVSKVFGRTDTGYRIQMRPGATQHAHGA